MRTWIKARSADVLCATGIDKVVGSVTRPRNMPIIVGYHRVVEDFPSSARTAIPSLLITREMLERQLDWIGRRYRFVDLNELGSQLEEGVVPRQPVAAVTFDDGYRDFHDVALPLLRKKGIPAALFVVTDLVGTSRIQLHDKLYLLLVRRLSRESDTAHRSPVRHHGTTPPFPAGMAPFPATRFLLETLSFAALQQLSEALEAEDQLPQSILQPFHSVTWEMLARICNAGIIVGSHTSTHVLMPNESEQRARDEARNSRLAIEHRLGTRVQHFAYPSGAVDAGSVRAVAAAGYKCGFTTCFHQSPQDPMLTVPRTLLWENSSVDHRGEFSGSILSCQLHGAFDLLAGCRQRHGFTRSK